MKVSVKSFKESMGVDPEDLAKYIANDFWMDPSGDINYSLKYAKIFLALSDEEFNSIVDDAKKIIRSNYPKILDNSPSLSSWVNE